VSSLSASVLLGWTVLAVGGFLSRTLSAVSAIALALMSGLMIGVLKGSTWASAVESVGLAVAFVPLGITGLRRAARPSRPTVLRTMAVVILFLGGSVLFGQLG